MSSTLTKTLFQALFLGLVLAFALGINYLYAWTGPLSTPAPACVTGDPGCDAPLNVGPYNQTKLANLYVGDPANLATDRGLISYGRVRSALGGIEFPDGTVQVTAAGGGGFSAIRTYTSSGTWTKPVGLSYVVVEVWGGGAGGQNSAGSIGGHTVGGAGGTSSFGSFVSSTGGSSGTSGNPGTGGTGSGGDININGGDGSGASHGTADNHAGGLGGSAPRGGEGGSGGYFGGTTGRSGKTPGGGGGGGGSNQSPGSGGAAGGYALERISATSLGATETITIGAGGSGGGANGAAGAPGMVVMYEYQ